MACIWMINHQRVGFLKVAICALDYFVIINNATSKMVTKRILRLLKPIPEKKETRYENLACRSHCGHYLSDHDPC
jgi:hypothetical protein